MTGECYGTCKLYKLHPLCWCSFFLSHIVVIYRYLVVSTSLTVNPCSKWLKLLCMDQNDNNEQQLPPSCVNAQRTNQGSWDAFASQVLVCHSFTSFFSTNPIFNQDYTNLWVHDNESTQIPQDHMNHEVIFFLSCFLLFLLTTLCIFTFTNRITTMTNCTEPRKWMAEGWGTGQDKGQWAQKDSKHNT